MKDKPYWNSYVAGIALGLVLLATYVVTGRGLGASGAMTRVASYAVDRADAMVQGGTDAEPRTIVKRNPYMGQYFQGDADPFDDFLVYLVVGVAIGGFLGGLLSHRFHWKVMRGPHTTSRRRIVFALLGGGIAGFGARLARGCASGLALSGGATLAVGSWAFMLMIFVGGYALAWFVRKEWT